MTVTAATVTCRHCKAVGLRNFVRRVEYLLEGAAVDSIICLICGDRLASKPLAAEITRPLDKEEVNQTVTEWTLCATPGCSRHIRPDRVGATHCFRCTVKSLVKKPRYTPSGGDLTRNFTPCSTPGCPARLRPSRVAAGAILCGNCTQRLNRRRPHCAALNLNPQEVNHVETIQELPRLAPPAPSAPAVCHQPRRPARLRRDDSESLNPAGRA